MKESILLTIIIIVSTIIATIFVLEIIEVNNKINAYEDCFDRGYETAIILGDYYLCDNY